MAEPETDGSMWEVEIIKLTDPGNFLARELPGNGKSNSFQEFSSMMEKMSSYLDAAMEQGEPPFKATLNDICAAHKGDTWYRLRIEEFIANSNCQKVRCSLIDVGTEASLNIKSLHRIPVKFKDFPAQVQNCRLSGVMPLTIKVSETDTGLQAFPRPNKKWDPSATTFMSQWKKDFPKCKAFVVRKGANDVLHVQLFFYKNSSWVNFNDELVLKKYAFYADTALSDNDSHVSPPSGRPVGHLSKKPGSHQSKPKISTSPESLEMPSLINDSRDIDSSLKNYDIRHNEGSTKRSFPNATLPSPNRAQNAETEEEMRTNKDISPVLKDFLKNVPDYELAACPPMPTLNSASVLPATISTNQTTPTKIGMGGLLAKKEIPGVGRGRAALLSNVVRKLNLKTSPTKQKQTGSHSESPKLADISSSPPPLEALGSYDSDSFASSQLSASSSSSPVKSPLLTSSFSSPKKSSDVSSKPMSPSILNASNKGRSSASIQPSSSSSSLRSTADQGEENNNNTPEPCSPNRTENNCSISNESEKKQVSFSSPPGKRSIVSGVEKDEISQVLADGFHSSASGAGVRLRERKLLDDVIVHDQNADVEKKKEILKNKKMYLGQQEGRKFLHQLRIRSGQQMISPDEAVPQTTLHAKSQQNPRLGTVVYGKAVPMGLYNLEHFPFTNVVKKVLKDTFDKEMALGIETFSWPSMLQGRHVIGIGRPGHENTLAYVPPLITLLSDRKFYQAVARGTGPLAMIVLPTWKKVQQVYEVIESFVGSSVDGNRHIKCIPLYAGGTENDHATQLTMMKGYEILVTTPNSFLRKVNEKEINLKRICHLIVDDVDILLSRFSTEIEHIMQIFVTCVKARGDSSIPQQILIFSKTWNDKIDSFRISYTKEPIVAFSSRVEASVYGEVKQVVTLSAWNQRLEKFCHLLDRLNDSCQKVIAWTTNVSEAVEMSKALLSQGIYTLLAHHEFESDENMDEVKLRWHQASQSKNLTVLVSTDPCYEDLGITDATTVIHYDIPSRTRFGNRLACMYQHFSDRMSDFQPSVEPVSHVILTEKCPEHARSLFDLLKRAKSTYPRQLESFVKGYQWGLQNEFGKELCPLLKAFGSCQNDRCELRHVLVPEVDFKTGETSTNDLPASGQVRVKVIHVVNSSRFFCHILQHRPLDSKGYVDKKLAFQYLVLEMSVFYSKPGNHVPYLPSDDLVDDGLCGFKDDSGTVDRAKVLEVRDGTFREPMRQCKVWLVDLGVYKFGTVDQLVKLPKRLAEVPYQAVEVFICRVKPVDHDLEWTKKADIFIENLVKDKDLLGRIVLRLGMTLWLDPFVHQVKLKGVGAANDLVIRQELLANNFATINPDHIQSLYELCRGKTEIPENIMLQYFDYCLEIEMTQETLALTKEFHEINMVGIFSPSLFYVQRWDKMAELDGLEVEIDKDINESTETDRKKPEAKISLEVGSVCLAESDGKWYRAKILSVKEDGVLNVFHLDYGTREDVDTKQTRPLRRHLAKIPCQAIECELAFVSPPQGEDWPEGTVDLMCNFAQYIDEIQKCLVAKVASRVDSLYTMGQKLVIDVQDATGVMLSEELVWRHKATCGTDAPSIKPLFGKPALKNQLFFNPLDKILYLGATIYWSEDSVEAVKQAEDLRELLDNRQDRWDSILEERDLFIPLVKLIGYIPSEKAHGIVLKALVRCCKESPRLCKLAMEDYLTFHLNYCLEMVDRFSIQIQTLEAVWELMSDESFAELTCNCEMKRTLMTFLHIHHDKSLLECQHLRSLCNAVAKMLVQETDRQALDSNCDHLLTLVQHVTSVGDCSDERLEPWLGLLAAVAKSDSQRALRRMLREKYISHIISLLDKVKKPQCLFHILDTMRTLAESDRKNKTILLEHNALIRLKNLLNEDIDYPVLCLCEDVCSALSLQFPPPETLAGTRLLPGEDTGKILAPQVTWTESCFRVMLKIRVKNAMAEDFTISRNRLQCNVLSDGERYVFDWELYGDVVPEKSSIKPHAYYTIIGLRKDDKGKWGRLLKNKTKPSNLYADIERLLNSDEEADVESDDDDEAYFKKQEKKKGIFDGLPSIRMGHLSSDESSSHDSLALNSSDSDKGHNDPKIDYESFFANYKR